MIFRAGLQKALVHSACDGCSASASGTMYHYAFCASEAYRAEISMEFGCFRLRQFVRARICWKLKKQSNSKRAKLSCGKQCFSKFLSGRKLQRTFAFLQKNRKNIVFSYCIIQKKQKRENYFFFVSTTCDTIGRE